jgi:hypothetical protein
MMEEKSMGTTKPSKRGLRTLTCMLMLGSVRAIFQQKILAIRTSRVVSIEHGLQHAAKDMLVAVRSEPNQV